MPTEDDKGVSPNRRPENPATLWAETLVAALVQAGLESACLAPGSRSTPLVLALAARPQVRLFRHLDERSAGFFALGRALATGRPVALVCTSGTAVANFFPAIVEARMSEVPLLILTADRPPELRHSGANQTIDQVKIFGDQVLWSVDLGLPEAVPPAVARRNLQTLAARALARAQGPPAGPVHLNLPLRKPLEPAGPYRPLADTVSAVPRVSRGRPVPPEDELPAVRALLAGAERGLILCGPRSPGGSFPVAVTALSERTGYPILADPLSGLRYADRGALGGYDTFLDGSRPPGEGPEVILQFGQAPTSQVLGAYLESAAPRLRLHIRAGGAWADDGHRVSAFWQADEALSCQALAEGLAPRPVGDWARWWRQAATVCQAEYDALRAGGFSDAGAVVTVLDTLPDGAILFAGNSLPVRHLDQFGLPTGRQHAAYGNRGASGIDGNISTALGVASTAPDRPLVALVGDITFYHDMNGLLACRWHQLNNITFVLLNNDGGGIFYRLPARRFEPPFTDLFVTPHGLAFRHAADLYGLDYVQVTTGDELSRALQGRQQAERAGIIEVRTRAEADLRRRAAVTQAVRGRLATLDSGVDIA